MLHDNNTILSCSKETVDRTRLSSDFLKNSKKKALRKIHVLTLHLSTSYVLTSIKQTNKLRNVRRTQHLCQCRCYPFKFIPHQLSIMLDFAWTVSSASARTSQRTVYLKLLFVDHQLFLRSKLVLHWEQHVSLVVCNSSIISQSQLVPHRKHSVVICKSTVSSV